MNNHGIDNLIACLSRVAERERARALAEFTASHGRDYDGGSDADWDALDKDHAGVEEAMNIARTLYGIRKAVAFASV